LPEWTPTLVIVLLVIGFPIVIIFSWIYDIHPEGGMMKTEPADKVKVEDIPKSSNSWKIASYISFVVIVGLIVLNIIPRSGKREVLDKSIAVLPFINDSPDEGKMYFINGTMEAILDNLCKIEGLRVPGRTSVEQYRDNPKPIPVVAEEMDVSYILEGSGQRDGNNVRLFVQLLEGKKDQHLWSKSYDADIEDIFSMQSEIAQLIAQEVQAIITPEEQELIVQIPTSSTDAYDLYLKGIQGYYDFWNTGDINNVYQSIDYFRDAIELDPDYSLAYTGLGRAYWMLGHYAPDRSPFHWEESKRLLKKAISLDSNNGWAYAELGVVYNNWDWDSTASKNAFEQALLISPHRSDVYDHYVHLAARMNDCKKLNALMQEIKKRFSPGVDIGLAYFNLKLLTCYQDYEKITKIANQEWNRNTNILQTGYIADAYTILGDFDKANIVAEYMIEIFSNKEYGIATKGVIQGLEGNIDDAKAALRDLELMSESRYVSKISLASISLAIGDVQEARDYLIKALEERDGALHEIGHMAPFYEHRNEPWLKEIMDNSWIPLEISNKNLTGVE
jgi:TolB-like protein